MSAPGQMDQDEKRRRLTGWLRSKLTAEAAEIVEYRLAAEGASNETILLEVDYRRGEEPARCSLVVRVQPAASHDCFPDADVIAQSEVLRAVAASSSVAVPKIVWEEADRSVIGAPFFVMERVRGRVPPTFPSCHMLGWVTELSPDERRRLNENALASLVAINRLGRDDGFGLLDRGRGAPGLDRHLSWVEHYYAWSAQGAAYPLLEEAIGYLRRERPETSETALLWGDARIGNMMFADDMSVAGVFDWEMASLGPPEVDLGWWLMMDWWQTEGFAVAPLDGFHDRAETIALYERLLGRPVEKLDYYEVLAFTRFVILSVRSTNLLIRAGKLPLDSTMGTRTPIGLRLARLLDLPVPELSPDYLRLAARYEDGRSRNALGELQGG